jgi:crotonobetainyl-CoA:carnitine CoA-transferase CaiB-like acyl-CoA transferase
LGYESKVSRSYPDEVDKYVQPWFMERTKEELLEIARKHQIAISPVRTIDEVIEDSHFRSRHTFIEVSDERTGILKIPSPPYRFSNWQWEMRKMAPRLGEDNHKIYCERLGYTREKLTLFRKVGVI